MCICVYVDFRHKKPNAKHVCPETGSSPARARLRRWPLPGKTKRGRPVGRHKRSYVDCSAYNVCFTEPDSQSGVAPSSLFFYCKPSYGPALVQSCRELQNIREALNWGNINNGSKRTLERPYTVHCQALNPSSSCARNCHEPKKIQPSKQKNEPTNIVLLYRTLS